MRGWERMVRQRVSRAAGRRAPGAGPGAPIDAPPLAEHPLPPRTSLPPPVLHNHNLPNLISYVRLLKDLWAASRFFSYMPAAKIQYKKIHVKADHIRVIGAIFTGTQASK